MSFVSKYLGLKYEYIKVLKDCTQVALEYKYKSQYYTSAYNSSQKKLIIMKIITFFLHDIADFKQIRIFSHIVTFLCRGQGLTFFNWSENWYSLTK